MRVLLGWEQLTQQMQRVNDPRRELLRRVHLVRPPFEADAHVVWMKVDLVDERGDQLKDLHRIERLDHPQLGSTTPPDNLERVVLERLPVHPLYHLHTCWRADAAMSPSPPLLSVSRADVATTGSSSCAP